MPVAVDLMRLERSVLDVVRLTVTDVPAGRAWRVMGSAAGYEWVAGEGVSTGSEIVFADPQAPLGIEASYVLWFTSSAAPADIDDRGFGLLEFGEGPFGGSLLIVRGFPGADVITDLSGRGEVEVVRRPGDPWEFEARSDALTVAGDALPVESFAPVAGAGGGELAVSTWGEATLGLRSLVAANRPVVVLHNKANCQVPACDVPPSMLVTFTGKPQAVRSGRTDRATREWSLSYRHARRPHRFVAPVVTWDDVSAHFASWAEITATGMTNAALARGDWAVAE